MSEVTRQARLDNWAMFVMNRLQIFFNKTDYCDLTLQFEGNVQLKVHRVIMNACTEYFQVLEETCEVIDDVLIMPPDLQADVILPIVNFMYTGILEYQQSIYDKLYVTAQLMNMSVLLKFLDAQKVKNKVHRNTLQQAQQKRLSPKMDKFPSAMPGRKLPVWKRKHTPVSVQINAARSYSPEPRGLSASDPLRFDNAPKPTRFEWPDDDMKDIKPFDLPLDSSFDRISYTTKPLLTQEEELRNTAGNSIFDDLRQLPASKPVKLLKDFRKDHQSSASVDMEDLKSYVKEHKRRSEYVVDDDPDDPDYVPGMSERKRKSLHSSSYLKKARLEQIEKEKENQKEHRIITTGRSDKVDHSKIISEVLKKYPHLVQNNKNIRLKILAKNKSDERESPAKSRSLLVTSSSSQGSPAKVKIIKQQFVTNSPIRRDADRQRKPEAETTWACDKCTTNGKPIEFVLYYLFRKHMTDVHRKQFDARDCKHCGAQYEKPVHMAYHMYLSHAVAPHRSIVFPRCDRCAYVAMTPARMQKHVEFHAGNAHHSQCANCKLGFASEHCLKVHMQLAGHNGKNHISFDCQYCTRQLNAASSLFVHLKTTHFEDAKKDGMLSLDQCDIEDEEEEEQEQEEEEEEEEEEADDEAKTSAQAPNNSTPEKKALDEVDESIKTSEEQSEHVTEQIAEQGEGEEQNLAQTLPFNIVVLNDQQQYILPSDNSQQEAQEGFMSLPQLQGQSYNINQADISSTDELVMVLTDHDYNDGSNETIADNSNIVVLYSHPVQGQQNQYVTTTQANLMLNSETGLLELHNNALPITTQSETIELIQKEMEKHASTTSEILADALAGADANDSTEEPQILEQPNAPKRVEVDDDELPDRKVSIIAVEQSGTGQLLDTIEEITTEQEITDYAHNEEQHETQPEVQLPEPMEVDDELKTNTLDSIPEEAPEEENQEFLATAECTHETELETAKEIVDTVEEYPEATTMEISSVPVSPKSTELDAGEKCNDVLESSQEDIPAVEGVEEELHNDTIEPMEVDSGQKEQEEDTTIESVENQEVLQLDLEQEQTTEQPDAELQAENPTENNETSKNEDTNETKCVDITTSVQEESATTEVSLLETGATRVDEVKFNVEMNEVCEIPASADGLTEEHAVEECAKEEKQEQPIVVEQPIEEQTETVCEGGESIATTEMPKDENISTLLNDWEDTDSQQSEQSKSASVKKLINDWDDD